MKARHTFNLKSCGFDYTKVRKIEPTSEDNKNTNNNVNNVIQISRPLPISGQRKKNKFQKD